MHVFIRNGCSKNHSTKPKRYTANKIDGHIIISSINNILLQLINQHTTDVSGTTSTVSYGRE